MWLLNKLQNNRPKRGRQAERGKNKEEDCLSFLTIRYQETPVGTLHNFMTNKSSMPTDLTISGYREEKFLLVMIGLETMMVMTFS